MGLNSAKRCSSAFEAERVVAIRVTQFAGQGNGAGLHSDPDVGMHVGGLDLLSVHFDGSSNMNVVDERHTTHSIAVWGSLPPRPMTPMKESAHERPFLGSFPLAGIRVSCSFTTSGWCWIVVVLGGQIERGIVAEVPCLGGQYGEYDLPEPSARRDPELGRHFDFRVGQGPARLDDAVEFEAGDYEQ